MTLGPISIAAAPGTGSMWLQEVLDIEVGLGHPRDKRAAPARHCPGPCTATIVRDIPELVRCWFVRFRDVPPIRGWERVVYGGNGNYQVYLGDVNGLVNCPDPDCRLNQPPLEFRVWLDAYLERASGSVTRIIDMFTPHAKYILHQETLAGDTVAMLTAEGIAFDEYAVRNHRRTNVTERAKPDWPYGYLEKVAAAG